MANTVVGTSYRTLSFQKVNSLQRLGTQELSESSFLTLPRWNSTLLVETRSSATLRTARLPSDGLSKKTENQERQGCSWQRTDCMPA